MTCHDEVAERVDYLAMTCHDEVSKKVCYLAMSVALCSVVCCELAATRLIPLPSSPMSYT